MSKKKAKFLLNSVLLFFLITVFLFVYNQNGIKADSELGILKSEKEFNIFLKNKNVKFSIKSYFKNGSNKNYLFSEASLFKVKKIELLGFEEDVNLCSKSTLELGREEGICLVGDVGAHSQNIAFLNTNMSLLKIHEAGNELYSIVSDLPSYQITDYNSDGSDDLIIYNRDYDKNPLVDSIKSYYLWAGDGYAFDKAENVAVK